MTAIRAVQIRELRISVDTLRASCDRQPYGYDDPALVPGLQIRAAHVLEPRAALDEYFDCRSQPRPTYPIPAPGFGVPVLGRHITEVRDAALTAK